ncbi:MAG: insulinase family protein, partial [Eubacteriaceae bacterium]|nr:insulinase family protein [Eubacteriaceae bacterium]
MLVKDKIYEGFILKDISEIKEIEATLYYFSHMKTKADLVFLSNEDDNKVFSIAFKTPVYDNTGVAHIIEHSVLNGSKKYPLKEPFVELLKGSLKTFLNAMTYPDKTIYPVASMNDKDFLNLIDVYLDGVLNPRIYDSEYVYMQEGWHYHLENEADDLKYNGVVYNEMKGAYSNPDEIMIDTIFETLYSDTTYKYSSGGKPEEIPTLTYKGFINFHKKYYHPSNSIIYLYGKMDIEKHLAYLNNEYLRKFEYSQKIDNIPVQKDISAHTDIVKYYPITQQEGDKEKEIYAIAYNIGCAGDPLLRMSFEILEKLLVNYPSSPLKIAFNDAKIGKEIEGHYETDLYYYTLMFIGRDMKDGSDNKFFAMLDNTLASLVKNGIEAELIDASINMYEFSIKDVDNSTIPKGLNYNLEILDSMLYGSQPQAVLAYKQNLDTIKASAHNGYFENLIKQYILENNHKTSVILKPKKGISEDREESIIKQLKDKKESLSAEEIKQIYDETNKLIEIQNEPDTKENLKKIPVLPVSDITNPQKKTLEKHDNVFVYNDTTQDIVYVSAYYDISELDISKYHYANLLSSCLTEMATKNYSFDKLDNAIRINTGGIDFEAIVNKDLRTNDARPQINLNIRFFYEKKEKAMELLNEIIKNSLFDDKKRLYEVVAKEVMQEKNKIIYSARTVLANRLNSYLNTAAALGEYMHGLEYYDFISDLYQNFEGSFEKAVSEMTQIYNQIFNDANVEILLALDNKHNDTIIPFVKKYFKSCDNNDPKVKLSYEYENKNEGLIMSTDVAYDGRAYDFNKAGYEYSGVMQVVKTMMQTDYLWNNVRVKGG